MSMTIEEAAKVRPPNDVIAELRDTEVKSQFNHEKLKAAFAQILAMPMLDMYTNIDDRCRAASKVLIAQLSAKLAGTGGKVFPMECKIINFTGVSDFAKDNKVWETNPATGVKEEVMKTEHIDNAIVYCICSSPTEGVEAEQAPFTRVKVGALRLWGPACKILQTIEKDKTYLIDCAVKEENDYYKMSKNDEFGIKAVEDDGSVSVKDMITRLFEPISIAEASYHQGVYKLLHARIKTCRTSVNKKGKNQGNMTVSDINAQFGKPVEGAPRQDLNITWWNAPEFCTEYGPGSEVYVMVDLMDKGDQYGLSGTGHFVIPILGMPFKTVFDMFDMSSADIPTPSWQQPTQQPNNPQPPAQNQQPNGQQSNGNVPSPAAISKW